MPAAPAHDPPGGPTTISPAELPDAVAYHPPSFGPLSRVRIVERFPWGGPTFGFNGCPATVIGMEARFAVLSDAKYCNDQWDYKLEIDGGGYPPIWLPSSALEALEG